MPSAKIHSIFAWAHYQAFEEAAVILLILLLIVISFIVPETLAQELLRESYLAAQIHARGDERKTVTIYVCKKIHGAEVIGIERKW